jgi:hypothetical protein
MKAKACTYCKKVFPLTSFHKDNNIKLGFRAWCKKCKKIHSDIYNNTENGFLTNLYGNMKKKIKSKRVIEYPKEKKEKYRCSITKKEFFELFEEHKKIFGYTCILTGRHITLKRTSHQENVGGDILSVDRLNPEIGYTKENIIFVSSSANNKKNAVTKELCIAILKEYEKRGW